MSYDQACSVLKVLSELPGYAPDDALVALLVDKALQSSEQLNQKQLYDLVSAADALGASLAPEEVKLLQEVAAKVAATA